MEFRLNKIDLELRDKIKEPTKEGKIHSKQNITIQEDKKNRRDNSKDFYGDLKQYSYKNKKKITINAVKKCTSTNINVSATKDEIITSGANWGYILDVKK